MNQLAYLIYEYMAMLALLLHIISSDLSEDQFLLVLETILNVGCSTVLVHYNLLDFLFCTFHTICIQHIEFAQANVFF